MADFEIETKSLDRFKKELDDLHRLFPKEAKRLMLKTGSKVRNIIASRARKLVKKHTGNYHKSIKRGKVWVDQSTGEYKVRAYTRAPHGHLIEYGHRIIDKDGNEIGFFDGLHVFQDANAEIEEQWDDILEAEFDKIMSKL